MATLSCVGLVPGSAQAETLLELTPQGEEYCCDDPDYGVKGYRFTVARTFTAYEAQWFLEVPAGTSAAARVRDAEGNLLQEGSVAIGDGVEQWVSSSIEFTFEAGQTYEVLFFLEAPDEAQFRRKIELHSGYDVLPHVVEVQSRSRYGHEDGPTTTYNSWPPFMRLSLDAPDADGDGVPDGDDACPDEPADPDADGDGCTDPPGDPSTTGGDAGGTSGGSGAEDTTGNGGGGSTTGSDPTQGGKPEAGETGSVEGEPTSSEGDPDEQGCGCTSHPDASWSWSLIVLLCGARRRRTGSTFTFST